MQNKWFRRLAPLVVIAIVIAAYVWRAAPSGPFTEQRYILDSSVSITIHGMDEKKAASAADAAFAEMRRIGDLTNHRDKKSPLAKINRGKTAWFAGQGPAWKTDANRLIDGIPENLRPGLNPTVAPYELHDIVARSLKYARETGGAFDPTIEPLVTLWGVGSANNLPTDKAIQEALSRVGHEQVLIQTQRKCVHCPDVITLTPNHNVKLQQKVSLDLGGASKGFAVDRGIAVLKKKGVKSALVTAVSSTSVLGNKPDDKAWRVGVENPRPGKGPGIVAKFRLRDGENVSTTGDYQRYFIKNGKRYHHVIDPKTGRPARGLMSVTVVTDRPALDADILSTALFVMGYEKGSKYLEKMPGTGALFITSDGKIHPTKGMHRYIEKAEKSVIERR